MLILFLTANVCRAGADEAISYRAYAGALRGPQKLEEFGKAQAAREKRVFYGAAPRFRNAATDSSERATSRLSLLDQRGVRVQRSRVGIEQYFRLADARWITTVPNRMDAASDMIRQPPQLVRSPVPATPTIDPALGRAQKSIFAHGVGRINSRVIRALRTAALHGDPVAQYDLGFCYQNGLGVAEDRVQAYVWYRRAMNTTAPALILDAASNQVRTLEAQLSQAQRHSAEVMMNEPFK